jgi:PAS domain S-box-containing protein
MPMRVGELARRTGVGVSTLRSWEARYAFLTPQRSPAGQRVYDDADVERIEGALRLIAEGLTLPAAIARVATVGPAALPTGEGESLLYHQILQAVSQGVWFIREGRSRYVNPRMAEIMRYSVDELVAISVLEIFEPDAMPIVRERTEQVRAGQRLHFTQELRRGDGTTFLAEVQTTPLFNQAGRYEGAVALVDDITDQNQKLIEASLRSTLLDSVGEAVTASAPDGTLVYVNAAAERLFGWRAADVIGRPSIEVFPTPATSSKQVAAINSALLSGKPYTGTFTMIRRDGSEFVAHITSSPAFDQHAALVGFVGVISDQTVRDQLDRDMQKRERQAEALVLLSAEALREPDRHSRAALVVTEGLEATRRLLQAERAILFDVTASNELHADAATPALHEHVTVPHGRRSFAGYVAHVRTLVLVDDASSDPRFDSPPTQQVGATVSAIGVPIFAADDLCGVLIAESTAPAQFNRSDGDYLQNVASLIAATRLPV